MSLLVCACSSSDKTEPSPPPTTGEPGSGASGGSGASAGGEGTQPGSPEQGAAGFQCNGAWSCSMVTVKSPAAAAVTVVFASAGGSCGFVDPNGDDEITVESDKRLSLNGRTIGNYTFSTKSGPAFSYDVGAGAVQLSSCKKKTY